MITGAGEPTPSGPPTPWWREAVVYQIYPRSFCDTRGDGVGDLDGVRRHLDHLAWLGVDALWLSPIYRSPMADFGYDVADHTDVDPLFGDLATFDSLLADAHARGLRVLLDWVPNHTSDRHPWFVSARASRDSPHRDWYVWRDGAPDGGPPNAWVATFDTSRPAWTWDAATAQWYLHLFLPQQPDLNWNHPAVEAAQLDGLRFWLDRGVDGFRADVVHLIGKDPALADDPRDSAGEPRVSFHYEPERLHPRLERIRALLDTYGGDRTMVGEINLHDSGAIADCCAGAEHGERLPLAFDFSLLRAPWDAGVWHDVIATNLAAYPPREAWPTWVLSNHDEPRHRTRLGSLARARAAALVLLTLRGTPFLFAGEELGLVDAEVAADRRLDPGGRDGARAPIPWDPGPGHGWAGQPWLPWPPDAAGHSAAAQREDPASTLHLYRDLLAVRRRSDALRNGTLELHDAPRGVLGLERHGDDGRWSVLVNMTETPRSVETTGDATVVIGSDRRGEGHPFGDYLEPSQGVLLHHEAFTG
ncbi:DUF3459 domain-containing protein [Egibacter rhizosphaerae]|uniref:DUF3459 domain-containing protein n=1 Tax=Egibacter rhizosphaerae TaxID=1670831 RepID=A0A411YIC6_9ACTN|nr:alpha-amylase family glycosyl hydrolase [Egibacter rhizosphaerae]QBI20983.1 DUF3459 domain-containing protein [Egibacter rhizosphaerae]